MKFKLSRFMTKLGATVASGVVAFNLFVGSTNLGVSAASDCDMSNKGCTCGGCKVNPIGWNQLDNCGDPVNNNWSDFVMPGGQDIDYSGCFAVSLAVMMKMSGDFEKKGTADTPLCPSALFNWGDDNGLWAGNELCPTVVQNMAGFENIFRPLGIDKSIIEGISANFARDEKITDTSEQMYKLAGELAQKGVYVILEVSYFADGKMCHFMPVIGTVPSNSSSSIGFDLIVADGATAEDDEKGARFLFSGSSADTSDYPIAIINSSKTSGTYTAKHINSLRVFISATPFSGKCNAVNGASLSDKQSASQGNFAGVSNFLSEDYFMDINKLEELALSLPTDLDLAEEVGYSGISELQSWRDTIDMQKADTVYTYIRAVFMFIGILIVVYSVVIFLAFQFDRVNNFLDVELLNMFTLGRLKTSADDSNGTYNDGSVTGGKIVTFKNMCFISLCGIGIGILLISGKVFFVVMSIIRGIINLFG